MEVPQSAKAIYDEFSQYEGTFANRENMIKYVMGDLSARANYTLSPAGTPNDKDFASYFLYENKKGYCTHFATAAALIFRSMGVPARYAEGYVVTAEDYTRAQPTEDGRYLINVRDTASHAWCEVYLDGYGWLPVEVTPGLTSVVTGDTAAADGESIEYETDTETEINKIAVELPKIEQQSMSDNSNNLDGMDGEQTDKRKVSTVLWVVLIFALFIMIIWGLRIISIRKWQKILKSNDLRTSILGWFKLFSTVCGEMDDISLSSWAKKQEKSCNFPKNTLTIAALPIQKAAYSNSSITVEEYSLVREGVSSCIKSLYQKRSLGKKLKWLFIKRLPVPKEVKHHV